MHARRCGTFLTLLHSSGSCTINAMHFQGNRPLMVLGLWEAQQRRAVPDELFRLLQLPRHDGSLVQGCA